MAISDKVLKALQGYHGDNEWDEIINHYQLDEDATEAADPSGMSDIAIFTDGSRITWSEEEGEWQKG